MDKKLKIVVDYEYDNDAKVWYVSRSDVPGLSLESNNLRELVDRVTEVIPDLLRDNLKI